MTDYYETRKGRTGRFVARQNIIPGLPFDGFLKLPNFFPTYRAQELSEIAHMERFPEGVLLCSEPGSDLTRSAVGVHMVQPFRETCQSPRLKALAEAFLGPCYIHQSRINLKHPRHGTGWHWHSDFETWHAQDGMPLPLALTAMIPLESNTAINGPLEVLPGSQLIYWSAPASTQEYSAIDNFADQKEGVPSCQDIATIQAMIGMEPIALTCEPGDCVLFDCNLMHRSSANLSDIGRANMFVVFNACGNELQTPYSASQPRPIQMGYRS